MFHKLNEDYLNPAVSCAVDLYSNISSAYHLMPTGAVMDEITIYSTLLFEAAIPLLLISGRLWRIGVMLAILFHSLLSMHSNVYIMSFSAEIFAMLTIFIPEEALQRMKGVFNKATQLIMSMIKSRDSGILLILIILGAIPVLLFFAPVELGTVLKSLFLFGWFTWCLILFLLVARYGKASWVGSKGNILAMPLLIVFPIVFIINGFTPYLGLKTATNFSMFSNLYINGRENNHLLIDHNYPLLDHSADQVQVISSNQPYFKNLASNDINITYFELVRWMDEHPDVKDLELTLRHNGEITDFTSLQGESLSWVEKKLLIYRVLPPRRPCPCQW
ncbi:MAG: hypothetical protein P8X57_06135 [Cyclobacteriaceae bacterium]